MKNNIYSINNESETCHSNRFNNITDLIIYVNYDMHAV